jgi:hypothetical protein
MNVGSWETEEGEIACGGEESALLVSALSVEIVNGMLQASPMRNGDGLRLARGRG